jgi:antitoxin VapB
MTQTAKIFKNGRSQAVRLPAEFRFDADEVSIRKDPQTGDVILSEKRKTPPNWDSFFEALDEAGPFDDDFLSPAERAQGEFRPDPFEDWEE